MSRIDPNGAVNALFGGIRAGTDIVQTLQQEEDARRRNVLRLLELKQQNDQFETERTQRQQEFDLRRRGFDEGVRQFDLERGDTRREAGAIAELGALSEDGRTSDPATYQRLAAMSPVTARGLVTPRIVDREQSARELKRAQDRAELVRKTFDARAEGVASHPTMPAAIKMRRLDEIEAKRDEAVAEAMGGVKIDLPDVEELLREEEERGQREQGRRANLAEIRRLNRGVLPEELEGADSETIESRLKVMQSVKATQDPEAIFQSLRQQYPRGDEQVLRGTAEMMARGFTVDRPEVSVSGQTRTRPQDDVELQILQLELEAAQDDHKIAIASNNGNAVLNTRQVLRQKRLALIEHMRRAATPTFQGNSSGPTSQGKDPADAMLDLMTPEELLKLMRSNEE